MVGFRHGQVKEEEILFRKKENMTTAISNLQWWTTNAPPASSRTDDIWFLDSLTGWAVNSNGQILKTDDGGTSWQEQHRSNAYLRCVASPSRSTAGRTLHRRRPALPDARRRQHLDDRAKFTRRLARQQFVAIGR